MAIESLKNFGKELKGIREKKAISLNEIHDKTRIDIKYLNDIEDGHFDVLPEVYTRSFLKKYGAMIDLEDDEIINKYERAKGITYEDPSKSKKIELDIVNDKKNPEKYYDLEPELPEDLDLGKKEKNKNVFVIGVFAIISVVVVILYVSFFGNNSSEIVIEKPIDEIVSEKDVVETSTKVEFTGDNSKPFVSTGVKDSLNLKINANDTSWMRIMIDNKFRDEFTLSPKLSKTIKAKSNFKLLIGNAGGVDLILNGKKLPKVGKKGEIKNISIDSSGIHFKEIKKP